MASSTPEFRSTQIRSTAAGSCSFPASKSTVFTSFKEDLAEKPAPISCSVSSMMRALSLLAFSPLPMPSASPMIACPSRFLKKVWVSPETVSPVLGTFATP